jgi:hypothetical protein
MMHPCASARSPNLSAGTLNIGGLELDGDAMEASAENLEKLLDRKLAAQPGTN